MMVTATPSAAPLTTKTSSRRRNSRFFSGAKKAMKGLRSAWITGGWTEGPPQIMVGRLKKMTTGRKTAPSSTWPRSSPNLAVSATGSTTAKVMPSRPNTSRATVTRVRSL